MSRERSSAPVWVVSYFLLSAIATHPVLLASERAEEGTPSVAPARVLATLDLPAELAWFTLTDTGTLVAYAGDELQMLDLLQPEVGGRVSTLKVKGLDQRSSVVPVPATGLLLVPDAPAEGGGSVRRSIAIDTLGGRIAWSGPGLGRLLEVELLLDSGVAVLRTTGGQHDATAIDLASGKVLWHRERVWLMWTEGQDLGVFSDDVLTIDARSGKVLRRAALKPKKDEYFYSFAEDGVVVLRDGRRFRGFAYPPVSGSGQGEESAAEALRELWRFRAATPMLKGCFKSGGCRVQRAGPDRLLVRSQHYELLDIHSGEVLWDRKRGLLRTTDLALSPDGRRGALATSKGLEVIDLTSGRVIHKIRYPESLSGIKLSKQARFIDGEIAMTVFPDKKGEPRGLTAFSCSAGRALWTLELPRSARYNLTSKEQSRLFSRIVLALVATAVSASHPMTYGGSSYAMVVVPNVHVSDRAGRLSSGERSAAPASVLEKDFAAALDRYNRLAARLVQRRRAMRYLPTGPKGKYEIQRINYEDGSIEPVVRYEASPVHAIYTDPGFEQAISLENDKRRLRLVSLSSTGDGVHEKTEASREE